MANAMKPNQLLLVEDDQEINDLLVELLSREGYDVVSAFDGDDGLKKALAGDQALIILDIMLPKLDGLEVLRELRKKKNTPVLMLTARGDDVDRIVGFEMGADDYLPKPFNPRELIARIKAILRRVELEHTPQQATEESLSCDSDIKVITQSRQVFVHDTEVELTNAEYNILLELLAHPGEVLDKALLTQKALGRRFTLYDRAIDMHVSNLRKKLGTADDEQPRIKTIRGVGYLLRHSAGGGRTP